LTPPLHLKPLGKWRVGLLDLTHSFILQPGYSEEDDSVTFPDSVKGKKTNFYAMSHYVAMLAKNPSIYTDSYFHEFLDFERLANFPNGFDDTPPPAEDSARDKFTIGFVFNDHINKELRQKDFPTSEETDRKTVNVQFAADVKYTVKQILYRILHKLSSAMSKSAANVAEFNSKEERGLVLFNVATNFVDNIQQIAAMKNRKNKNKNRLPHSKYMFLYTDLIGPRYIGSEYHPVLSVLPIKEIFHEYSAMKNVVYFPVKKEIVDSISVRFNDEYGAPLALEPSTLPTCVTLHFKRDL
jgi:hypothetical protein